MSSHGTRWMRASLKGQAVSTGRYCDEIPSCTLVGRYGHVQTLADVPLVHILLSRVILGASNNLAHKSSGWISGSPPPPCKHASFRAPTNLSAAAAAGNRVMAFKRTLDKSGIPTSVRITRGLEASAACGQLRNRHQKEPMQDFSVPS